MSIPGLHEVKSVKELWSSAALPKFGYSSAQSQEKNCEQILVLMQCTGNVTERRYRASLPPNTTLRQAKNEYFDKNIEQKTILDENNFRFSEQDLDKPIWLFSNRCGLSISFQYENHVEGLQNKASSIRDTTTQWFKGAPAKQ